jgi:hypothetical protein
MDRLGNIRTTNPGIRNEKQLGCFISDITALKVVFIQLAVLVSLIGWLVC